MQFDSNRAGSEGLWEMEVASGRLRQLIPNVSQNTSLGVIPVIGSHGKLACAPGSHEVDLYWLELATGMGRQLTTHTGENMNARVSPDGQKLVYRSNRTGNVEIWLLDLATGEEMALTDHPATDSLPDWSPDGREILFVSDREGASQLGVMSSEGGALRRISEQTVSVRMFEGSPSWSPDGALIGYLAPTDRGIALWVIDKDGTNARPRVRSPASEEDACRYLDWRKRSRPRRRRLGTLVSPSPRR